VRRGLFSGCLLVVLNALIVVMGLAVILSLHRSEDAARDAKVAPPPPAAETGAVEPAASTPATIQKTQDRLAPSNEPARSLRLWRSKADHPAEAVPPEAAHGELWRYGEAKLRLDASGRSRRFAFANPLGDGSPKEGDLAFDGVREGRTFLGLAFVYLQGCEPLSYSVRGAISADEATITLRGMEPRLDARCEIAGAGDRELIFTRSDARDASSSGASWTPQTE
jgi:hypothetical protein